MTEQFEPRSFDGLKEQLWVLSSMSCNAEFIGKLIK